MIIGYQALWFGLLMQTYAETRGILPKRQRLNRIHHVLTLERGLILGVGLIVFGVIVAIVSFFRWRQADFGALNPGTNVRTITPAILGLVLGAQTILGSFSIGVLAIRTTADEPPASARRRLTSCCNAAADGCRVLTAAHYWPPHVGGVEFEAREQSRRLVARGHDVTVVSSRIGDDRALSYDDGFPVHKVAASNVLEERVRLPYPLFSPKLFSLHPGLARDADVVVAHTHTFMSTIAAARAARRQTKPFVLIQNNPFIEYRFPLNLVQRTADATIARYTVGSADRLVAISEFTADYVRRLAPGREVTVMHLGTDVERFSPVDRDRRAEIRRAARLAGRRVHRAHRSPPVLPQRPRHAARRGHASRGLAGSAPRDRRVRARARRDQAAHRPRRASPTCTSSVTSPTSTFPTTTARPTCSSSRRARPRVSGSC